MNSCCPHEGTTVNRHTHTHPSNGPLYWATQVSQYQKTNLDFTEARDSEWQRHQLGHMQVCTSPQTDNHTSTPPLSFLQAVCRSCCPTNSIKALTALNNRQLTWTIMWWRCLCYLLGSPSTVDTARPWTHDLHYCRAMVWYGKCRFI